MSPSTLSLSTAPSPPQPNPSPPAVAPTSHPPSTEDASAKAWWWTQVAAPRAKAPVQVETSRYGSECGTASCPCTRAPSSHRTRPFSSSLSRSLGAHVPSTRALRLASVCSVSHRRKGTAGGWACTSSPAMGRRRRGHLVSLQPSAGEQSESAAVSARAVTPQCHLGFLLKSQTKNHYFM
jgi:hypothetical protein